MQKNKQIQPVVVEIIKDLLDKQTEALKQSFATKDDLQSFATKDDLRAMEERIDEKAREYRDEILTSNDKIVGELDTIREEQAVSTGQYRDHEERIAKLEKLQGIHQ